MARLMLSLDGQILAEYNMNKERYTIGRLPDTDIRIDNPAVSGHHSLIINILNDERVMTANRRIVDTNIVVRKAPDRVALFVHVVFREDLTIQAEHQACHLDSISLTEPSQDFVKYTPVRRERLGHVRNGRRHFAPPAVVVGELYQLFSYSIKISTKGTDC